ncbi:MAG: 16S rRNA (cytosine(1402)-N(4))-methyltransferase RsmH [bacterium]|nr:16S rRNA (cytosine(1402)-N(4))-methyltransferase RsmH [bacterium]
MSFSHRPVLLDEVLSFCPATAKLCLDFTLGGGGHSAALLRQFPELSLIGSDRDEQALAAAKIALEPFGTRAKIRKGAFAEQAVAYQEEGLKVDYILADLGVSSHQLDRAERGFSFGQNGPLDMRMDPSQGQSVAELLAQADEKELTQIFYRYGEESFAPRIAARICARRTQEPLTETAQLADLVFGAIPRKLHPKKIHPATKVFQALRIAVNDELGQLDRFLESAKELLNLGGRLAIISFHSLEDRPVKQAFVQWESPCICPPQIPYCQCGRLPLGHRVTKKPVTASEEEIAMNPRARSAKLRIFERQ